MTFGKRTPHLVMLLTQDLESPSGLGRYFPLAKYLVREGYQISIFALHSDFANLQKHDFEQEGVRVHYVAQMHVRKSDNKTHYFSPMQLVFISLKAMVALYRESLKENADLIFVGKPHPMNGLAGLRLKRHRDLPLIVDCDDYEAESNRTSSPWQKKMLAFFERKLPKKADLVTTNTYFMRDQLINWGVEKENIVYLPNGVDTERFSEPPQERVGQLKTDLGLNGKHVIGYFGSLNLVNHPVDLLLRSFKRVAEQIDEAKLLIVGGGNDLDQLKELVVELELSDRVVFTGWVRPDEMNMYYQLAEVSVDPVIDTLAVRGRCPLKLFESWQMGVPVATSDVGDRKILSGDSLAILLTEPGDEISLAKAIKEVLMDDLLLQKLRKTVESRSLDFNWATLASQVKVEIEKLIRK